MYTPNQDFYGIIGQETDVDRTEVMEYIRQSMTFEIEGPTVLSLGKFDGLHRGHELLMQYMARKKREVKA